MRGYKIIYGRQTYDCWGAVDFEWFGTWSDTIYTDKEKCLKMIEELKDEHRLDDYDFKIKEVVIDWDCSGYDEAF